MCQDSKRTCRTIVLLNLQGRVVRKPVNVNPGLNVN